jgi:hypothetical protein
MQSFPASRAHHLCSHTLTTASDRDWSTAATAMLWSITQSRRSSKGGNGCSDCNGPQLLVCSTSIGYTSTWSQKQPCKKQRVGSLAPFTAADTSMTRGRPNTMSIDPPTFKPAGLQLPEVEMKSPRNTCLLTIQCTCTSGKPQKRGGNCYKHHADDGPTKCLQKLLKS